MPGELHDWFRFADRDRAPYNPLATEMIATDRFWRTDVRGSAGSPDWIAEEWAISSVLVPTAQLEQAADVLYGPDIGPGLGWVGDDDTFGFGEQEYQRGIETHAWVLSWPAAEDIETVMLRQDFLLYHALRAGGAGRYVHPIEGLVVAEVRLDAHSLHHPTPNVTVHRDYLRDYLAAKRMGLIICLVSDRFASASGEEALGLDPLVENDKIGEHTWTTRNLTGASTASVIVGRSTLWRNFIIAPHDRSRIDRSPWHHIGPEPTETRDAPQFILDADGNRGTLFQRCPPYLYFRPEVLRRYLTAPGYSVGFHMRSWGGCGGPKGEGISVGINSRGLVNAFAKDLRKQGPADQAYWASYSCLPSGEVCAEMVQTQMQCDPPDSPGVIDLLDREMKHLGETFSQRFGHELVEERDIERRMATRLSVGPLSDDVTELRGLAMDCYKHTVERMSIQALRRVLATGSYETDWKQIKLLEVVVTQRGVSAEEARQLVAPMRGLNELRISAAHVSTSDLRNVFLNLTGNPPPANTRGMYEACVDSIVRSIRSIAKLLAESPTETQ